MKRLLIALSMLLAVWGICISGGGVKTSPIVVVQASDSSSVSDMLKGVKENTYENQEAQNNAQQIASPIVKWIGTLVSVILIIVSALQFVLTALDLLYLSVPPVRDFLYQAQDNGSQGTQGVQTGNGMMGNLVQQQNRQKAQATSSNESGANKVYFVSPQMRVMADQGVLRSPDKSEVMKNYFTYRAKHLILLAAVFVLLIGSNLFTDFGWNIGYFLLNKFFG
jgi:hypothetical protein